jgi:hypothetical protein
MHVHSSGLGSSFSNAGPDQDNGHLEKTGKKIDTELRDRIGSGRKAGLHAEPSPRKAALILAA